MTVSSLQEAARQEAERVVSTTGYDGAPRWITSGNRTAFVDGFELGAAWAEQEAAALLEAARAYKDAQATYDKAEGWQAQGDAGEELIRARKALHEVARNFEAGEGQED